MMQARCLISVDRYTLQQRLIEHARSRGLLGFTAEILAPNGRMIHLAKRACDRVSIQRDGDTLEVTMRF